MRGCVKLGVIVESENRLIEMDSYIRGCAKLSQAESFNRGIV
jgi:hypothetical protein